MYISFLTVQPIQYRNKMSSLRCFSSVTSTNVGISPKVFQIFSFKFFTTQT